MLSLKTMLTATLLTLSILTLAFDSTYARRRLASTPPTGSGSLEAVVLVIGKSATVGTEDNFELVRQFGLQLVDIAYNRSNIETLVAVVSFAEEATIDAYPHPQIVRCTAIDAVKNIDYAPGQYKVNLNAALKLMIEKRTRGYGARRTAIVITDAEDNVPKKGNQETLDSVQALKDDGTRFIIVGIAHDRRLVNMQRWKRIVSNPETDLIIVKSFKQLSSAASDVQELIAVPDSSADEECPPCHVCPDQSGRYNQ